MVAEGSVPWLWWWLHRCPLVTKWPRTILRSFRCLYPDVGTVLLRMHDVTIGENSVKGT